MPADVRYVLTSRFLETIHVATRRSNISFLVAWLLGIAVLCTLGTWQVKRLAWKEAMIARVEKGLDRTPVSVLEIERAIGRGEDIEYPDPKTPVNTHAPRDWMQQYDSYNTQHVLNW